MPPCRKYPLPAKRGWLSASANCGIFDPTASSGEFLFSSLLPLRRALRKLEGTDESAEAVIRRQLRDWLRSSSTEGAAVESAVERLLAGEGLTEALSAAILGTRKFVP